MCHIKTGKNIETLADLRNMITGIILQQEGSFNRNDIICIINKKIEGSVYHIQANEIELETDQHLACFCQYDVIKGKHGVYSPSIL